MNNSFEISDPALQIEHKTAVLESGQIYIHCHYQNGPFESGIRIWKTTYVIDRLTGTKGELLHAEKITYAPQWTWLAPNRRYQFLLIFAALPSACTAFDLIEDIAEPYGFFVGNIQRNSTDVYHVTVGS